MCKALPSLSLPVCLSVSHLEFEAVDDVLDVGAGQRLSEAQLFGKVDLVVEFVELLQKLLLRHRAVQDGAATTRTASDKRSSVSLPVAAPLPVTLTRSWLRAPPARPPAG